MASPRVPKLPPILPGFSEGSPWHPPMRAVPPPAWWFDPGLEHARWRPRPPAMFGRLLPGNAIQRTPVPDVPYATLPGYLMDPIQFWGQAVRGIPAVPGNEGLRTWAPRVPRGLRKWNPYDTYGLGRDPHGPMRF